MPLEPRMGFAKKPKGWSRRHDFLAAALAKIMCDETCERVPLFREPVDAKRHGVGVGTRLAVAPLACPLDFRTEIPAERAVKIEEKLQRRRLIYRELERVASRLLTCCDCGKGEDCRR